MFDVIKKLKKLYYQWQYKRELAKKLKDKQKQDPFLYK